MTSTDLYLRAFKSSKVGTPLGMPDIIGRAEMVLRRRYDIAATDAYALLVKVSEQQNRSLDSVAQEVIARLRSGISADLAESS
jgi:AmiR/NasT family two-component response regulator